MYQSKLIRAKSMVLIVYDIVLLILTLIYLISQYDICNTFYSSNHNPLHFDSCTYSNWQLFIFGIMTLFWCIKPLLLLLMIVSE
jgi:hypothetical protein